MSGSRAKSSRQAAGSLNGPGPRAVPAYASASPLDFQEPWQDEAAPNSHPRGSADTDLQRRERQGVAPVLSVDELPEDWEESAPADEASDEGLQKAESASEHAEPGEGECASPGVDDESLIAGPHAESSPDPASKVSESVTTDATLDVSSTARPAHANAATNIAAAATPTNHPDVATSAAECPADSSKEGLTAAALTHGRQQSLAAQDSASPTAEAHAAMQSAGDLEGSALASVGDLEGSMPASAGDLEDLLLVCEAHAPDKVAAALSAELDSQPTRIHLDPGEEEALASAAKQQPG